MKKHIFLSSLLTAALLTSGGVALAANQAQETIYGSQLMTQQERNVYRAKLQAAASQQERNAIRAEHHKLMQERAREQNMTLPDMPAQQQGMGKGMGGGKGQGMGSGR